MGGRFPKAVQVQFRKALRGLAARRRGGDLLYASASPAGRLVLSPAARRPLFSHVATGVEIGYVLNGAALVVTPRQVFRLVPGKVLVIERGVEHAELPGSYRRAHRIFWCHLYQSRAHLADNQFLPSRGLHATPLDLPGRTNLERIGQTICAELSARNWGHHRVVCALLSYISYLVIRRIRQTDSIRSPIPESPAPVGGRKVWLTVQAALEFCHGSFHKRLTRDDVAKAVGYSPSYLGHVFSTYLGHSLSEYLKNLRIVEGKRLLEESELTVHEIASALGYTDPAHFTRAFTRVTGLSPTGYRQQVESL